MKKSAQKKVHKKVAKRHVARKSTSLFSNNQDWLIFAGSMVIISVCVFYLFNLFQF